MDQDESGNSDSVFRKYRETFVALGVGAACVLLAAVLAFVLPTSGSTPAGQDAPSVVSESESGSSSGSDDGDGDGDSGGGSDSGGDSDGDSDSGS